MMCAMSNETHKLAIAIEYLETAATLWVYETNLFSAIHLAAAADEIAAKACRIAGKGSHFDDLREKVRSTLSALKIEHTERQLIDAFYGTKNSIKHMDSRNDATVNMDAREESGHYIVSAYQNFRKLGLQDELPEVIKKAVAANAIHIAIDA